MNQCKQCGRRIRWWHLAGPNFCSATCKFELLHEKEEAEKIDRDRALRAAEKAKEIEEFERQVALDTSKRPFVETVIRAPRDPDSYIRLADFLVEASGFGEAIDSIDPFRLFSPPTMPYDLSHVLFPDEEPEEDPIQETLEQLGSRIQEAKERFQEKIDRQKVNLNEANEGYFKAIALGATLEPFAIARAKLKYSIISILLGEGGDYKFYAREAEKDLRKHLRKDPDDILALKMHGLSISLYQERWKTRWDRLIAIQARIKESETRQQMDVPPPIGIRAPGAPVSPYPDDWDRIRGAIKDRDEHQCTQCGSVDVELHVHHVVPLSTGGSNEADNLVTLCDICHSEEHSAR